MTLAEMRSLIETRLRQRWPDLTIGERVSGDHTTLVLPPGFFPSEIDIGPRGGITINDFRSFPSVRDGTGGNLTALEQRARWDR